MASRDFGGQAVVWATSPHEVGSEQTFLMDNAARREGGLYGSLEAWAKALVVGEHFL